MSHTSTTIGHLGLFARVLLCGFLGTQAAFAQPLRAKPAPSDAAPALMLRGTTAPGKTAQGSDADRPGALMDVHAVLGVVALASFSSSLVIGAASGNLGKLTDPAACCPDGGTRDPVWRTTDRILVTTGIVAYSGAAALALYNLLINEPVSQVPRHEHEAHRWLALAHGAAFLTSAVTGIIMMRAQDSDAETFASTARIHTASNVVLVPLLSVALSNILFE